MIARSSAVKALAFLGAVSLHGALLWGVGGATDAPLQTEGHQGETTTRLGNSFADLAQQAPRPAPTAATETAATPARQPEPPQALLPQKPAARAHQPAPAPLAASAHSPAQKVENRPLKAPKPAKAPAAASPAQTKGSSDGSPKARPVAKSTGSARSEATGNAAAQNYPGQVMRKISRVPKPRVRAKGSATLRFTIAPDGRLAKLTLTKSSGRPALDKAALNMIRRAAPFAKPPTGAQRSFTLTIKGRP